MKNDRHGKAKILTKSEIQLLFSQGFQEERDHALFGICLFPARQGVQPCFVIANLAPSTIFRVYLFKGVSKLLSWLFL